MRFAAELDVHHHGLRFRTTAYRRSSIIEVHLLFPHATSWETPIALPLRSKSACHWSCPGPPEVITHLESLEDHEAVLSQEHDTGRPE
jgi:hypothetical protein